MVAILGTTVQAHYRFQRKAESPLEGAAMTTEETRPLAPDVAFTDEEGRIRRLSDLKGEIVVLLMGLFGGKKDKQ